MFEFTLVGPADGVTSSKASVLTFTSDLTSDKITILADPGWDGTSDLAYLDAILPSVDLILLSHPTVAYIGAVPFIFQKDPSLLKKIPVYTTLPVSQLGKNSLIEQYRALGLLGPFETNQFELEDIDRVLNEFKLLKHGQSVTLAKLNNLKIHCHNAGHTLGGCFWSLHNTSNEKVIYAPTWNHSKDSFLNSSAMLEYGSSPTPQLLRPTAIITSSDLGSSVSYKQRVQEFYNLVDNTIQRGGTVVLPTSIGGRLLELVHLIDEHLQHQPIPVILMSYSGTKTLSLAGNLLEWMSPQVIKNWEFKNQVPFDASAVDYIDDVNEIMRRSGSKVIFLSDDDGTRGSFSNEIINRLSKDDKTTIILTERSHVGTLGGELYQFWEQLCYNGNAGKVQDGVPVGLQENVDFFAKKEDYLSGEEMEAYTEKIERRREDRERLVKLEEENKRALSDKLKSLEDEGEDDDDDDEGDDSGDSDTEGLKLDHDALSTTQEIQERQQQAKDDELRIDYDLKNVARNRNKVFPFLNPKIKVDDYGEAIDAKDYVREQESSVLKKKFRTGNDSDDENDEWGNRNKKRQKKQRKKTKQEEEEEMIVEGLKPLSQPKKLIWSKVQHSTRCALSFIDLSGTVDLRSYLMILHQLKPKKVILYNAYKSSTKMHNIDLIKSKLQEELVVVASKNKPVTVDNIVTTIDIKLDEALEQQLKWQKLSDGYTLSHVIGELQKSNDEYVLKPLLSASNILTTNTVNEISIGDLKLSDLRLKLKAMNYDVVFKGEGILSVNNDVCLIRKANDDGDLVIDGTPNDEFYIIRDLVNGMLAHV